MSTPGTDELVLRARLGDVVVRTVLVVACCAVMVAFDEEWLPWSIGLVVLALAAGIFELRSRTRFGLDRDSWSLELPDGTKMPLDSILEVSVSRPHVDTPNMSDVSVHLGAGRWVPLYCGSLAWAQQIEAFIARAKQARAQSVPVSERARAVIAAVVRARGGWDRSERIICLAIPRGLDVQPIAIDDPALREAALHDAAVRQAIYESILQRVDRAARAGTWEPWREVPPAAARSALARAINRDLAYQNELGPEAAALPAADAFMALFAKDARYFTDARLSDARFDGGLLAFDERHIGLLWFESDNPLR
jgi:hypothetical protein